MKLDWCRLAGMCETTLPASSKASASTEAPTKADLTGNTSTIVVDRGLEKFISSYILPFQIKNFPRVEDIAWVKSLLYPLYDVKECIVHPYREVCLLIKANAVLS